MDASTLIWLIVAFIIGGIAGIGGSFVAIIVGILVIVFAAVLFNFITS